jgi:hypothetical protein
MMDPVIWHWFLGPVVPSSSPLWQSHLACGPARGIDVHYSSHETSRDQVVVCIACAQTNPTTPYSGFGTFGMLCRQICNPRWFWCVHHSTTTDFSCLGHVRIHSECSRTCDVATREPYQQDQQRCYDALLHCGRSNRTLTTIVTARDKKVLPFANI